MIRYVRSVCRTRLGIPDVPRALTFITTFRCNARCVMCGSWRKPSTAELSADEINGIFRQLPGLDVVRLSGGEPFLRPDFPEIAAMAQSILKPRVLHITTNGIMTEKIVEFCRRRDTKKPLHLLVSIDGMEEHHDHVRGKKGIWSQAMETLSRLAPERRGLNLELMVNQTIMDNEGLHQFGLVRDSMDRMGVPHGAVLAYRESATYGQGVRADERYFDLSPVSLSAFLDKAEMPVSGASVLYLIAKRYYYDGIRNRFLEGRNSPNPRCSALSSHMRLNPDGTVPVCQFNGATVGTLRGSSFRDVWYGGEARKWRDWVRQCAGCWAECEVLPSGIYSGDIITHSLMRVFRGKRARASSAALYDYNILEEVGFPT